MAIAYKSAGAGAATETSAAALSPACPATVDAGDILIAHTMWEGTATAPATPSGWTLLHGPAIIQTTIARHWVFGKVADGTEDAAAVAFGSPAVTTQRGARVYSFSGRVSGTIAELVTGFAATSHATDPQMPTVTTTEAGNRAVALVALNDNAVISAATGESGGDWTEAVAEYLVVLTPGLTLQLQTAVPTADPGTITGGVASANELSGVIGFQIKQAGAPVYDDTVTGTVSLSGTNVESKVYDETPTGTVALSGSVVESYGTTFNDTVTGTIGLSGSVVESMGFQYDDAVTGTIALSGSRTEGLAHDATLTGTVALSGSVVEEYIYMLRPPFTGLVREGVPLWLAVEAIHDDGRKVRWGFEEDPEEVATGLGFSTSLPGGFAQGNVRLPRDLRKTYHDVGLLRDTRFYGPANRTAYEGRIQEVPGSGGGAESTLEVLAEGHAAHLKDDNSFTEIYVDRDLRNWQGISLQRQSELIENGNDPSDGSVAWDIVSGAPAIVMTMDGQARNVSPISESWYDAGNQTIKKIYYDYALIEVAFSPSNYIRTDSNFNAKVGNADSEHVYTSFQATSDLAGNTATSGYITFTTNRRYGWLQFSWNLTVWGHSQGYIFAIRYAKPTVYGNHGLTLVGSHPQGVYGSDVIADALARVAPELNFTIGSGGSIEPSTFVIPHLLFRDPSTAEAVILAVTALGGASNRQNDWGIYDNKEFFWRSPETYGRRWRVSIGSTTTLQDEGPQIEDAINGIIVVWTDAAGNTHTVGPTGSGLEATDASLLDTDDSNPANEVGLQRWPTLSIGTTTFAGAVQVGALFLSEARQRKLRGEINHVGPILDDKGVLHPPWAVRAGDTVEVLNLPDPGPFRIVSTTYNHDSLGVSMALDSPPARLEVLLERWTAVLASAGI